MNYPLNALHSIPIVAILRGIRPTEVVAAAQAIYDAGIRCIEVPLNSPQPLDSIAHLAAKMPPDCLVGAGTVLTASAVDEVASAGGKLVVAPNTNEAVIRRALGHKVAVMPGIATATDAFNAFDWGARRLKLFPASTYGVAHLQALKSVLPKNCKVYAVGGVGAAEMEMWLAASVDGFGIGSEIYRAGDSLELVSEKAHTLVTAYKEARSKLQGEAQ